MNYSIYLTKRCLRQALLIALSLLYLLPSWAADFGVAQWGMSLEEVKSLETRTNVTPFNERKYLIYQVDIANLERVRIVYQFTNNQLSQGRFLFSTQNPRDTQGSVRQYQYMKSLMNEQYGPANTDQVILLEPSLYPLAEVDFANELASDRLILKSSWRNSSASLNHQLAWHRQMPHHQLVYTPFTMKQIQPARSSNF